MALFFDLPSANDLAFQHQILGACLSEIVHIISRIYVYLEMVEIAQFMPQCNKCQINRTVNV